MALECYKPGIILPTSVAFLLRSQGDNGDRKQTQGKESAALGQREKLLCEVWVGLSPAALKTCSYHIPLCNVLQMGLDS